MTEIAANVQEEERFRREVLGSFFAVKAIEMHLRAKGNETRMEPLTVRPNFEVRKVYGDDCDLFVRPPWKRIEVKGRTFDFTCEEDFPFDTIIIDRATKEKETEIDLYVNVSKCLRYGAFVHKNTRPHWITRTIFDRTKGYEATNYECPKQYAHFVELLK